MADSTLIANGTVVTADGEFAGDVLIEGETIAAVGRVTAPPDATTPGKDVDAVVLDSAEPRSDGRANSFMNVAAAA